MRLILRGWKLMLPLAVTMVAAVAVSSSAVASSSAASIKIAIMTDCQGTFGGGYELDIGGAQAALSQYAGAKPKDRAKPSAGITGGKAGGKSIKIVGYGCGNDTAAVAIKETKRLMEQLGADVMIGPLSGDEAVAIAAWAKAHPTKTVIIGTAGSQDPTLQQAPKNVFRYHGDGAMWNAGTGILAYKKLGWRNAAIIMDDYSFGWTSGAGLIADFCGMGGKITKRVFPPLGTTDYASYVQQLPAPNKVDGYFWVVGGTGTGSSLKAYEQAYGPVSPKKFIGNLFFAFLGNFADVAPRLVGAYVGGFGTAPGSVTPAAKKYEGVIAKWYGPSKIPAGDGFTYNYYTAAWAFVQGANKTNGAVGAKLQAGLPRFITPGYQISSGGKVVLNSRRQGIQDQYPFIITKGTGGTPGLGLAAFVPNVDQTFGGFFKPTSPPPGRSQPPCVKHKFPWQGKVHAMVNGKVTSTIIG